MESRDFSDFEAWTMSVAVFPDDAALRFKTGTGDAPRLGLETRFWGLETNKDRRVGFMFKAPSARDYWRSQKTSSIAARI
jgi:hypothetical protein